MDSSDKPQRFNPENFIKTLTKSSGVYQMLGANDETLYVGKARNLKARVSQYFNNSNSSIKTQVLVKQIYNIQITITNTEAEALLLESNLIKQHKPRYNVSLRDDKSFPYIYISTEDKFPRLAFHRGNRNKKGQYFGPYPSAGAVRETLGTLQKLFKVRQCEDNFFKNRSRPCLQYQIKRCTAPCVNSITEQDYQEDVQHTLLFLEGRSNDVVNALIKRMDKVSEKLQYEQAAQYRDQIQDLHKIHQRRHIVGEKGNIDIVAGLTQNGISCIQIFYIREGLNLGSQTFYPKTPKHTEQTELLSSFISQYYLKREIPETIIVNTELEDQSLIIEALSAHANQTVKIVTQVKGERAKWLKLALTNAEQALKTRLNSQQTLVKQIENLQDLLQLDALPERFECFDISHTQGEATVAACVVFDTNGPVKTEYRRFNIKDITPGDDYAAMQQALNRRYTRIKKGEAKLPDVLFIDGGKGQVQEALNTLEELQIDNVCIVGIAKGPDRIPGKETLIIPHLQKTIVIASDSGESHFIQKVRDEAHRFAITGHRAQRGKKRQQSILEDIDGLGPKRRQSLLKQFGGLQGIRSASIEEISKVPGISQNMAQLIYDSLQQTR